MLSDTLKVYAGIANANRGILDSANSILSSEKVDQQALPTALEDMNSIRSLFEGMAQQSCLIASRELESDSPTWKMALECADATRGFSLVLADIMERGRCAPANPDSGNVISHISSIFDASFACTNSGSQ